MILIILGLVLIHDSGLFAVCFRNQLIKSGLSRFWLSRWNLVVGDPQAFVLDVSLFWWLGCFCRRPEHGLFCHSRSIICFCWGTLPCGGGFYLLHSLHTVCSACILVYGWILLVRWCLHVFAKVLVPRSRVLILYLELLIGCQNVYGRGSSH